MDVQCVTGIAQQIFVELLRHQGSAYRPITFTQDKNRAIPPFVTAEKTVDAQQHRLGILLRGCVLFCSTFRQYAAVPASHGIHKHHVTDIQYACCVFFHAEGRIKRRRNAVPEINDLRAEPPHVQKHTGRTGSTVKGEQDRTSRLLCIQPQIGCHEQRGICPIVFIGKRYFFGYRFVFHVLPVDMYGVDNTGINQIIVHSATSSSSLLFFLFFSISKFLKCTIFTRGTRSLRLALYNKFSDV